MPHGAFSAARHFDFDDTWLNGGTGSVDFKDLRGYQDFRPQAVLVNSSTSATQNTAGYAVIDGVLFGENDSFRRKWPVDLRRPVGLAIRKIWAEGTTARGIAILTEQ
jgi:hypothetical protein